MLNPFPIQWLALLAYFLLRLFIGGILIFLAINHYRYRRELQQVFVLSWFPYGRFISLAFPLGECIIACFILAGAWTQFACLALMVMSSKMIIMRNWFDHHSLPPKIFYVLLFGATVSLFITGAGLLAFDLPI